MGLTSTMSSMMLKTRSLSPKDDYLWLKGSLMPGIMPALAFEKDS